MWFGHEFVKNERASLALEDTLRLFSWTFKQYKIIRKLLENSGGFDSSDHFEQLAVRQLHIAILRKYILQRQENVHLIKVVESALAVLPPSYSDAGLFQITRDNIKALTGDETKPYIEFIKDSAVDSRSLNTVVIDYLYGLLLHGDYQRASDSLGGNPLNVLISSSDWFAKANIAVVETSFLVERAIFCLDQGWDYLADSEPLTFTSLTGI